MMTFRAPFFRSFPSFPASASFSNVLSAAVTFATTATSSTFRTGISLPLQLNSIVSLFSLPPLASSSARSSSHPCTSLGPSAPVTSLATSPIPLDVSFCSEYAQNRSIGSTSSITSFVNASSPADSAVSASLPSNSHATPSALSPSSCFALSNDKDPFMTRKYAATCPRCETLRREETAGSETRACSWAAWTRARERRLARRWAVCGEVEGRERVDLRSCEWAQARSEAKRRMRRCLRGRCVSGVIGGKGRDVLLARGVGGSDALACVLLGLAGDLREAGCLAEVGELGRAVGPAPQGISSCSCAADPTRERSALVSTEILVAQSVG